MNNTTTINADAFLANLMNDIAAKFIPGTAIITSASERGGEIGDFDVQGKIRNADGSMRWAYAQRAVDAKTAVEMKRLINE